MYKLLLSAMLFANLICGLPVKPTQNCLPIFSKERFEKMQETIKRQVISDQKMWAVKNGMRRMK